MNHEAIYALYPQVVTIDDESGAFDANGNKVEVDTNLIDNWINPNQYQIERRKEYPPFEEQFDLMYHGGYDAWKTLIQDIKNKYPKPLE
jgi:hypothetical protein